MRPVLLATLLGVLGVPWGEAVSGQGPDTIADLPIEELMAIDVVTAASRFEQTTSEAPASVTIVTSEEIRRFGYRTLAEVLGSVPGFYTTYDHNYAYVGVRGFSRPGGYNTRILLMIDGHRLNDGIYDYAAIGTDFILDLGLVERVEVVRGPSIYGTNAAFAVVNVVTRSTSDLMGLRLGAEPGSQGALGSSLTFARESAQGVRFLAGASVWSRDGAMLQFDGLGSVNGLDGDDADRQFVDVSHGRLRFQAARVSRDKDVPTAPYGTLFGQTGTRTQDVRTYFDLRYQVEGHELSWMARLFADDYDYTGNYVYEGAAPGTTSLFRDRSDARWAGGELQAHLHRGNAHDLVGGIEVRDNLRMQLGAESDGVATLDRDEPYWTFAAYLQDELPLHRHLRLHTGLRYDVLEGRGPLFNPRIAVIATPRPETTWKLLYNAAFRAPNTYEQHYYAAQDVVLDSEKVRTVELNVDHRPSARVRVAGSVYSVWTERLITLDANPAGDLHFINAGEARGRGVEWETQARWSSGIVASVGGAYQRTRSAGQDATNSPSLSTRARLLLPLGSERRVLGAEWLDGGPRRTQDGGEAGGASRLNLTLSTRFRDQLTLDLSAYNVLDRAYADPSSEEHVMAQIPQDGRTWRARLGVRF